MFKGITIKLFDSINTGVDEFERPIYQEVEREVENVLITPVSSADMVDALNLTGKTIVFELCIPKGDTNIWTDRTVEFFGERFHTIGYPEEYIESLLPLQWNKKVKVERNG